MFVNKIFKIISLVYGYMTSAVASPSPSPPLLAVSPFSCWLPSAFLGMEISSFVGKYEQVYSSKYLSTTTLLGLGCVNVTVTSIQNKQDALNVTQDSIQHDHKDMKVRHTRIFSGFHSDTNLLPWNGEGGVGPSLVFSNPKYLLRCAIPSTTENGQYDVLVWTGLDNLSLEIWTKDSQMYLETYEKGIMTYLEAIDFNNSYKKPVLTYDPSICSF